MWPSSVFGLGLGLFAKKNIKYKQVCAVYTGQMRKCVTGSDSRFLVQALYHDKETGKSSLWYLDASHSYNAAGKWANDACDYDGEEKGTLCNDLLRLNRKTNIAFRCRIASDRHEVYQNYYIEMYALDDIPAGSELFVKYGLEYWNRAPRYFRNVDPLIMLGDALEHEHAGM